MPSKPPFRKACGDYKKFKGCCVQHSHGPENVDKYVNTTVVDNWDTGVGGTIPAYERWTQDLSGAGSCEVHFCVDGGAPCAAWQLPFTANAFSHTPGDQVNFAVAHKTGFKNVQAARMRNGRIGYTDVEGSGGFDTVLACGSPATLKTYRSYKASPNNTRYGRINIDVNWTTHDGGTDTTSTASVQQTINSTSGILNKDSLSLSPNSDYTSGDGSNPAFPQLAKGFWLWTDICSLFFSVFTADTSPYTVTNTTAGITVFDSTNSRNVEVITWDLAGGSFERQVYSNIGCTGWGVVWTETVVVTADSFTYEFHQVVNSEVVKYVYDGVSLDLVVTGALSLPVSTSDIKTDIVTLLDQWDLSDDKQYPWRTDIKVGVAPLVTRDEVSATDFDSAGFYLKDYGAPITDPSGFTIGDSSWIGDTGYTLNPNPQTGTYRIAIDYPGFSSGAAVDTQLVGFSHTTATVTYTVTGGEFPPGVSMDASGHITGTIGDDGHYGVTIEATCGVPAATGVIIGAPNPAGYQDYFDFRFIDIRGCCQRPGDGSQNWDWYQVGWGQLLSTFNGNSGCHLPLNATQWNNWFQSINKPAGAWIFYADKGDYFGIGCVSSTGHSGAIDAPMVVAQKWAEIIDLWPSQNFALPAGDMKFWFDETKVCCATNVSGSGVGSTWTLIDPATGSPPTFIDFGIPFGGPVVDGFYFISAWDGTTATLGAKQFDLPSNWTSKSDVGAIDLGDGPKTDADSCFGALRWSDKPSLLGRVAITTSGTTATFSTAQPAFGMDASTHQEQVDIYDASMTSLASNVTARRVNDTSFTTSASYPTAAWVQIHGSAKWYVNDTGPKGDYVKLDWTSDFRSFGEANRLGAITGCDDVTPVSGAPTTNAGGGPIDVATQFASFNQTQCCLPFAPCSPKVVCISPNGETFANGITYGFPSTFTLDEAYGSKWWAYVQATMTDLFWQKPHRPCNIEDCAKWTMDVGTCADDTAGTCPATDDTPAPEYFFAHAPQVEARLTVPSSSDTCGSAYGPDQTESGPALPEGIQIGWLSPVTNTTGDVALPPAPPGVNDDGTPGGAATAWDLHQAMCTASTGGCRFNYSLPGC